MNYIKIDTEDVCNGDGLRVVLWLSGCNHHCYNCQNPQTWDVNSGIPFDESAKEELFRELDKDYISGLTLTGGDPLHEANLDGVLNLVNEIRLSFGDTKTIWIYSGYTWNDIWDYGFITTDIYNREYGGWTTEQIKRQSILKQIDIFVDGQYIDSQRNVTLKWCGSSNQRVVNVQQSLQKGEIILWC